MAKNRLEKYLQNAAGKITANIDFHEQLEYTSTRAEDFQQL